MTGPVWQTVMATGHRPGDDLPPPVHGWVRGQLDRIAVKLRNEHCMKQGHTGMALGADMWWADSLHRAGIPYVAHIPFPEQPDPWWRTPEAVDEWKRLRALAADETVYGDLDGLTGDARKRRAVQLLHKRNDGMLDAAAAVVAVWDAGKRAGGTFSAVVKAHGRGLPVVHVNPAARTVTMPSPVRMDELLHPDRPEALPLHAGTDYAAR